MRKNVKLLLSVFLIILPLALFSQTAKKFIREGNERYSKANYPKAQEAYQRAINIDSSSFIASFNLGDAIYKQKKYSEASKIFQILTIQKNSAKDDAIVLYNIGNTHFEHYKSNDSLLKTFDTLNMTIRKYIMIDSISHERDSLLLQSIDYYKKSLRKNPNDFEAKYNLYVAQKIIKKANQQKKQNEQKKTPLTAFAIEIKKKADELTMQYRFKEAHQTLTEALQKDKSIENYNDFIGRLKGINDIKR